MKGYLSAKETAEKWGISVRWVNQYIREGRIPGCEKLGNLWAVPEDAIKPEKQPTGPKPRKRTLSPWDGDND
ncbi:MAG: helix-turn-helix domain-containing protein [Lachnospiraceae bacterium]|nr:helix-turn-helix domain-containing protein [Lachnospiraceae bacterium]